ncbi:TPA: RMD1 family protein [Candidatus Woesearchaeota archaeon]|nr:RMD1 family protein [Candidatus Woesearchaeota archaeon]
MVRLKAIYIAKEIPIAKIKGALPFNEVSVTRETAVYRFNGSVVYVYSFGSIVFADTTLQEEKRFISMLGKKIALKRRHLTEEYAIEKVNMRGFKVRSSAVLAGKPEHVMGVVARVLAQSVALESYEDEFDRTEQEFSEMNAELAEKGRLAQSSRDVLRMIARNNAVMEEIVSGIGVLDKPDAAWENAMIDALHARLVDEFELNERFQSINSKMEFVQENYKVFLESLRSRKDSRLEWIIIILIAIEILLFVYELFW